MNVFAKILLSAFIPVLLIFTTPAYAQAAQVYYGAYAENNSELSTFESEAGKPVSLFMLFQSWNEGGFPTGDMNSIRSHGSIPVVSWDSYIAERPDDTSWQGIADGKMDSYITQWANDAKNWGHPFFLRFDWEMNGYWVPYAKQTSSYIPMWKHIHDIFTKNGATNVTWVWCPNIDGVSTQPLEPMYPGGDYVDWVCMDGYNFGNTQSWSTWTDFQSIFGPTYNHLVKLAPGKPIMIAEIATTEQGGSKADWIKGMFNLLPSSFPNIKALIWFNIDKETNWRIDSSDPSKQAFSQGVASSYYASNQFGSISSSPIGYLGSLSTATSQTPRPTLAPTKKPTPKPTSTPTIEPIPASSTPEAQPNIGPQKYLDYINNQIKLGVFVVLLLIAVLFLLFRINQKRRNSVKKK